MNLKVILFTLLLMGGGLSWPFKAKAEPPTLAQVETAAASSLLPWQLVSSTQGQYIVELPGTPEEQTSTSTLFDRELTWHMSGVTVPAVDETDLFEYYLVAYIDIPRSLRYEYSQRELLDSDGRPQNNDFCDTWQELDQLGDALRRGSNGIRAIDAIFD